MSVFVFLQQFHATSGNNNKWRKNKNAFSYSNKQTDHLAFTVENIWKIEWDYWTTEWLFFLYLSKKTIKAKLIGNSSNF